MKDGIHPKYQDVVIKDISSGFQLITKSTKSAKERITVDGVEYPLVMVEVSSASHPYYTGKQILVDSAGRIDRFKSRYAEVVGAKRHTRDAAPEPVAPKTLSKTKQKKLAAEKAGFIKPTHAATEAPAEVVSEAAAEE